MKRISIYGCILVTFFTSSQCGILPTTDKAAPRDSLLWYGQPAAEWEEALPIGNGRIGAMIFGGTRIERLQLNDDSMWPGDKDWDNPAGTTADLKQIRQHLFAEENAQADALFVEKFSRKGILRSHQTMGDLFIEFGHDSITDYRRSLDLDRALVTVSYQQGGTPVRQTVFASHPHQAIVIELQSEAGLHAKLRMSRPEDEGQATARTKVNEKGWLVMDGEVTQLGGVFDSKPAPIRNGVKFQACLKVEHEKGEVVQGEDYLELKGVNRAVLYIVANSSYYYEDYPAQNQRELAAIEKTDYQSIKRQHIQDHQALYRKASLTLPTDPQLDSLPTDHRLERMQGGTIDLGMQALLFHYGRYLLIASSRPGTNPANLQGLWNRHVTAPWNADYHLNINLQMNYWPANLTSLDELNMPLFDYVDKLIENGKVTAWKNFGCRGAFIPHATDLWAPTYLRAPTAYWGCSMGAGGWMMQHYWAHFAFTGDTVFLRERAYPALKEVAQFYSDWLIEDPRDGTLISAPSTSPENQFIHPRGDTVATCLGSAMDQQVIAEVFDHYLKACHLLNIKNDLQRTILAQQAKLRPGFVLGRDGRILEWDREYQELEPGHRHISHLYGFHPGTAVTPATTPDIFAAAKKTLEYRLENGGAGTGWSRAWLINCSGRLQDGAMAQEHIQLLFERSMYPNLFDAHPPFQIDGNFGYTAGVAELLLQSHEAGRLHLLPALPPQWVNGFAKGLGARGGLTVDLSWQNNTLEKVSILPEFDQTLQLIYSDEQVEVVLKAGELYEWEALRGSSKLTFDQVTTRAPTPSLIRGSAARGRHPGRYSLRTVPCILPGR